MLRSKITPKTPAKALLLGIILLTVFSSCKQKEPCPPSVPQSPEEVVMQNTAFVPAEKTITKGTTVKWINKDPYAHTVTSSANKFDSGNLNEGQTFQFKFDSVGTYDYYCKYHLPNMTGKIIVK